MAQVIGYHRPTDIDEALELLTQADLRPVVLAGGTTGGAGTDGDRHSDRSAGSGARWRHRRPRPIRIGAMVRLQDLVDHPLVPVAAA